MKKFVTFLGVLLVTLLPACCVHTGFRHSEPRATQTEALMQETVAFDKWIGITGQDEDGDDEYGEVDPEKDPKAELRTYCSGVWVTKDTVLTAEHCVHELGMPKERPIDKFIRMLANLPEPEWDPTGQPCTFSLYGEIRNDTGGRKFRNTHSAKVLSVDQPHDLALVKITEKDIPAHPVVSLASDVHAGEDVHVIGHPSGQTWTYTHGWVAQVRPDAEGVDEKHVDAIQISAPIWFGNSGGGAFNERGQLIGIASWIRKGPNFGYFIHYDVVRRFLSHNGIKR